MISQESSNIIIQFKPNMENNRVQFTTSIGIGQKLADNQSRGSIMQNITNSSSTFHRSTISTSKTKNSPRNISNEKSKIKMLPNYERYSMGNNLPFVTIFQTIEIERLSDEIETQRVKLKQYERCIFNANNFEIQIKELSQRCTSYEYEINQYREQLDKMNKICETLFHENENLKNKQKNLDAVSKNKLEEEGKKNRELIEDLERFKQKYRKSEENKQNQIQTIKIMIEKQRKSMIDREIKDMEVKYRSQIEKLAVEIRRLNDILLNKQKDMEDFRKRYINEQDYRKQLKSYNYKINEYEEKINLLNQEKVRLGEIIDIHANELDLARKKQYKLTQQLNTQKVLVLDNEQLKYLMEEKEHQLSSWTKKTNELESEVFRGRQLIHIISQLQLKYTCMNEQNEKLIKILKQRSMEIQKWQKVAINLEEDNKRKRQIEDLLIEKQAQCKVLQAEQQCVENINKTKNREFEELKNKYQILQNQGMQYNKADKQKKNLQDKNKVQFQRIIQLQSLIQSLQKQLQGNKQINNKLRSAQSTIESYKRQNQLLHLKLEESQNQLARVKQNEMSLGKEFGKMKQNQIFAKQYQDKLAIMNMEISRLSELLKEKNDEIVSLEDQKINSYTIATQYKRLQNQLQQKQQTFAKLKSQSQNNKQKILIYEQRMQQIDEKNKQLFSKLKQQIDILQNDLKQKTKQCQELKVRQQKIQSQISEKSQLERLCQKQQNKLTVYLRDLEDLRMQNKQYETKLTEGKHKNQQERRATGMPQLTQMAKKESLYSSKPLGSSTQTNSEDLLTKITKLQLTTKDLKLKYGDLLKQLGGSSSNILGDSFHASLRNLSS